MSAGKGDSPRPVNLKVYRENFDAIDWRQRDVASISHLEFMRSIGFDCRSEEHAYELRGLLDI
jgi:hypothetical protein